MNNTRRGFLTIAGATIALPMIGLPTLAAATPSIHDHPLMLNVKHYYETMRTFRPNWAKDSEAVEGFVLRMNAKLITDHPEMFNDPEMFMPGPVGLYREEVITAKTRMYRAVYTMDMAVDVRLPELTQEMIENELLEAMVGEFHAEIVQEQQRSPGLRFHPYMPIICDGGAVDPATFEPIMRFKTRYATS